ncbi:MAG: RND transporter [Phycisphaeraceae bacterium]|nr:RND transporter [Phycisphaeraceae bacterium]
MMFLTINRKLLALSLCSSLLVTGCTVGPDYKKPQANMPEAFHASPSAESFADLAHWWKTFNDPMLDELIDQAITSNLDMQLAQARIRQARAQLIAAGASLKPTVNATAADTLSRNSENANGVSTGSRNLMQAGFDANWEIDVFGGNRRSIEASQASYDSIVEQSRNTLVTLLAEVATNYIQLRGYQYELSLVNANVVSQQDTLDIQESRLKAGITTDLTVAQAQALVQTTRAQIPTLQAKIKQTIHRLGVLLGQSPASLMSQLETIKPIPLGPPSIPTGVPAQLLRRRPDIRAAERSLAGATAQIGVQTAELYPKFTLNGTIGLSSTQLANFADNRSLFYSLGPGVSWRLFDGNQIKANIQTAEAQRDQAAINYQQSLLTAMEEVENALVFYDREQTRRDMLGKSVDANQRAADHAIKLNDAGLVDFINVLTAKQSLNQAQSALARSQTAVSADLVYLYKVLGGGWELPQASEEATMVK